MTLNRQILAVIAIHSALKSLGGGHDTTGRLDRITGETDFFPLVDSLVERFARWTGVVSATEAKIDHLKARKARATRGAERARDILEDALRAASLPILERPLARLYLAPQPAKLLVETASTVPARYWHPQDPQLNEEQLTSDLMARRAALEGLLATSPSAREPALEAFEQRFLTGGEARRLRARLVGLDTADSPEARTVALAALRRDFANIPGARLAEHEPRLTIVLHRPAARRRARGAHPWTPETAE